MPRLKVIRRIYEFLEETQTSIVVLYGGAGSGKSWTMAQFLLCEILFQMPARVLVTRKYNPSLRLTTYTLFKDLLETLQVPFEENKFEQLFFFPFSGARLYFRGLDEPSKIQSAEFNFVWMEEAMEFSVKDYQQLRLRLRHRSMPSRPNQLFLTFNPTRKDWIYKLFFQRQRPDTAILHTTYQDNPFLSEEYKSMLESLSAEDKTAYRVFAKGEFVDLTHIIYPNYVVTDEMPTYFDTVVYGVDFGYNNPSVVLRVGLKDNNIYVLDELYRTHLTNQQLIELMKQMKIGSANIYCDSAEPARIQEIRLAGFNALPYAKSGKIKDEIDLIKRHKIFIHPRCANTLKEIESYSWKLDKEGNPTDEPVKFNDHAMDALRYAVCGVGKQQTRFVTSKPEV